MRRFVQALGLKRDKHDSNASRSPSEAHLSSKSSMKAHTLPFLSSTSSVPAQTAAHSPVSSSHSTPHLSSASTDPSSHSSGSSSGSASVNIHAKDEELGLNVVLARSHTRRSWKSWIGARRSGSLKSRDRKNKEEEAETVKKVPDWNPLSLPSVPSLCVPVPVSLADDTDDDVLSSRSASDFDHASAPEQPQLLLPRPSIDSAKHNLRVLLNNAILPMSHPPPFIRPTTGPIYPRSTNSRSRIQPSSSLQSDMLKKHLLKRIDDSADLLSPREMDSILPFGSKPTPVQSTSVPVFHHNIHYPDESITVLSSCPGLRKWICRPCFEDRFVNYLATNGGEVVRRPVSSSYAVAALEYSEVLDVMSDPDFELPSEKGPIPDPPSPPEPSPPIKDLVPSLSLQVTPSPSSNPRRLSHTAIPSPLRNEHMAASLDVVIDPKDPPKQPLDSVSQPRQEKSATVVAPFKRVVRFAGDDDEDDDDGVPLHLIRMKKKREERAKFIRLERQRRIREEMEEQQRREAEAYEAEKRRQANEKERREREQRLYAEQFSASRQRSEQSRAGAYALPSSSSSSLLVTSHASTEPKRNLRAAPSSYSPRGSASEFGVHGSSSGGSRPPSRPASTYSASSEEARASGGSHRGSLTPSMRSANYPYPVWSGSSQSLNAMVPMPQLAAFATINSDMPLLPPAAPFMKQSRQSSSPSRDSRRNSSASSDRRVSSGSLGSYSSRNGSNQSLSRAQGSPSPIPGSQHRSESRPSNHVRNGSGDSRETTRSSIRQQRPPPPTSYPSQQHTTQNRGRPPMPAHASAPSVRPISPWTALPSRNGTVPLAMPVSPYTHRNSSRQSGMNGFSSPAGHDWRSTLIS